jgi:hypothetical protein
VSLAELLAYSSRRRIRIGITTTSEGREPSPVARMLTVEASMGAVQLWRPIGGAGDYADLDQAAGELLELLKSARGEEDGS